MFAEELLIFPSLSANLTPVRAVQKLGGLPECWFSTREGRDACCFSQLTALQDPELENPQHLCQRFCHSCSSLFSPLALMSPSAMGSSERQIPDASSPQHSLFTSCSTSALVSVLQWALLPGLVQEEQKQLSLQSKHVGWVMLKHHTCLGAVIFPPE